MPMNYDDNERADEDGDLKLLFHRSEPSFDRVNIEEVFRDATVGAPVGDDPDTKATVLAEAGDATSVLPKWGTTFKSIGLMGVCAASICMAVVMGLWDSKPVLAQVQNAIRNVQTATYTVTHITGIQQQMTWEVRILGEDLCRVEQPNGMYLIFDIKGKRIMEVNPLESKVRITENVPVPNNFNVISTLSNLKASAVKDQPELPNREIDGKAATGFIIDENGTQFEVWVDQATNLPLEMQRRGTSPQNRSRVVEKWSNFRFDEPMDKSLFVFEVPTGFAIDTRQPASPKKATTESYGFDPKQRKP